MSTAAALPSGGGVHFAIPEGTTSTTQPDSDTGEGHDSWREWGVDRTTVASVDIPTSVTRIEGRAFAGCSSLAIVTIPARPILSVIAAR